MTESFATFEAVMDHAVGLAARGEGRVEPNPAVGAVGVGMVGVGLVFFV